MYISLDCEMGGIDLKYSLLSAYFVVLDDQFNPTQDLYLRLKPDDGDYIVCAEAMGVNKINLVEHDKLAIPYKEARAQLGPLLRNASNNGAVKLRALGHGVSGDIRFVWDKIYDRKKWEAYVSYRNLDTATICQFLKDKGTLPTAIDGPEGVSGSLMSLVRYFGIFYEEATLHDAKVDTLLTVEVYKRMLAL
jgi:hypothetical protein